MESEEHALFLSHASRLPAVSDAPRDYFEKARAWASTGLVIAAALLVLGSLFDWVTVEQLPATIPANQADKAEPFNGFDVGDGVMTTGAGVVLAFCAVMLMLKARSSFGWLAFLASMVAGGIAISDYRGIDGLFEDFGGIGKGITPGIGLTLVAIGALLGLISSVAGVAASPNKG
ncbi:MAG: hypothetical protein QOG04_164 [Actinomycetota bacterium]|nr:hypothetical protein [Actinomycetota bacterium]